MSATDKVAQYMHLLGTVSDREIAMKAGVSRTTVASVRRCRGIPAFRKTDTVFKNITVAKRMSEKLN